MELDLFDDSGDDDEEDGEADESSVSNLSDHEGDEQQHNSYSSNDDSHTASHHHQHNSHQPHNHTHHTAAAASSSSFFSLHPTSSSSSFSSPSSGGSGSSKVYSAAELSTMQLALLTCHRSLIFLGDLERYSQLILGPAPDQPTSSSWTKSERYYRWALALMAVNGNPHNQLAVVATYKQNNLLAVHRYFRSIAVRQPFATAMQNLKLLFDKANAACFDSRTEVLVRVAGSGQQQQRPGWMGAGALMKLWSQPTVRPLLQVASLHTAVSGCKQQADADSIIYAPLLDVIRPFQLRERYAADQHPVRIRSSSASPGCVDLLVTGDHKVWTAPVHQPRSFDLLPAAQLVPGSDASGCGQWNILTATSIHSTEEFCFILPPLSELLSAACDAGIDVSLLQLLDCAPAQSAGVQLGSAAMDAWLAFVGLALAAFESALLAEQRQQLSMDADTDQFAAAVCMRAVLRRLAGSMTVDGALAFPRLAYLSATASTDDTDSDSDSHDSEDEWCTARQPSLASEPRLLLYHALLHSSSSLPLPAWLWQLSARQLRILLHSASHASAGPNIDEAAAAPHLSCDWCGAAQCTVASIVCPNQQRADELHSLAVHAGLPCQLRASHGLFVLVMQLVPDSSSKNGGGIGENVTGISICTDVAVASATFDASPSLRQEHFWCVTTAATSRVVLVRRRASLDGSGADGGSLYSSCAVGNCSTSILHQQHLQHHPAHKVCCSWYEPGMATVKLLDTSIVHLLDVLYTGRNTDSGVCLSHAVVARLEQLLLLPAAVAPVSAQSGLAGPRPAVLASGGVSVNVYCLQLLLDGVFCVHQHVPGTNIVTSSSSGDEVKEASGAASAFATPPTSPPLPPSFFLEPSAGSLSFLFLFDFVRSLMSCMSLRHPASLSWLGIVGVWCDWLHLHPSFIEPLPAPVLPHSPRSQPADEPSAPVSPASSAAAAASTGLPSPYLEHQRVVFSRCWLAFAHACNVLAVAVNSTAADVVEAVQLPDQPPLREELEVYGFSYLSAAYPHLTRDFYWRRSDPHSLAELTGAAPRDRETHSPPSLSASTVVSGSSASTNSGSGSGSGSMSGFNSGMSGLSGAINGSSRSASSVSLLPPSHKARGTLAGAGLDRKQYRRAVKVLRFADYLLRRTSVIKQDANTGQFFAGHFAGEADIAEPTQPPQPQASGSISAISKAAPLHPAAVVPHYHMSNTPQPQQQQQQRSAPNGVNVAAAAASARSGPLSASLVSRSPNSATLPTANQPPPTRSPLPGQQVNVSSLPPSYNTALQQQQQQAAAALAAVNAHIQQHQQQQQQQQQQQSASLGRQRTADRGAPASTMHPSSIPTTGWREAIPADRAAGRAQRPIPASTSHATSTQHHHHQQQLSRRVDDGSDEMDAELERRMAAERERQWEEAEQDSAINQHTLEHRSSSSNSSNNSSYQPPHGPLRGLIGSAASSQRGSGGSSRDSSPSPHLSAHAEPLASRYRPSSDGQLSSHSQFRSSPPLFAPSSSSSSSSRGSDGWENYRSGGGAAGTSNSPQPDEDRADGGLLRGWTPFDNQSLSFLHQSLFPERGPHLDAQADSEQHSLPAAHHSRLADSTAGSGNSNQPGAATPPGESSTAQERRALSSPHSLSPLLYPSHSHSHSHGLVPSSSSPSAQPGAVRGPSPPPPGFQGSGLLSAQPASSSANMWQSRADGAGHTGSGLLSAAAVAGRSGAGVGALHTDSHSHIHSATPRLVNANGGNGSSNGSSSSSAGWSSNAIGHHITQAYAHTLHSANEPGSPADGRSHYITDSHQQRQQHNQQHQQQQHHSHRQQYDAGPAEADWAMMDSAERMDQHDIPIGLDELLDDDDGSADHHHHTHHTHHMHQQQQQQSQPHYSPHSSPAYQLPAQHRSHIVYDSAAAAAAPSPQAASQSRSSPSPTALPYRPPHLQPHRQPPLPRSQPMQQPNQQGGQRYR